MLTESQVITLRKEWGGIKTVDPSSPVYQKLTKFLDGLKQPELKQLAEAKIPFISSLSLNRLATKSVNRLMGQLKRNQ
jgi:hypothetical protein